MGKRVLMEPRNIYFCDECGEEKGKGKDLRTCIKCGRDLCEDHRVDVSVRLELQKYQGFSICYVCMPKELLPKVVVSTKYSGGTFPDGAHKCL
jgi:hypothetical protein